MKKIGYLIMFSTLLFLTSCEKDDKMENIDCDVLTEALINLQSETVKYEISKLTLDLKSNISDNDKFGHSENLDLLIERINKQCNSINASLGCYACIETLPPQSEIIVSVDSSGNIVKRVIDILTPQDKNLSYNGIHEYFGE